MSIVRSRTISGIAAYVRVQETFAAGFATGECLPSIIYEDLKNQHRDLFVLNH